MWSQMAHKGRFDGTQRDQSKIMLPNDVGGIWRRYIKNLQNERIF